MGSSPYSGLSVSEIGRIITTSAYDGSARPMFATLIAVLANRRVWPM
jgi:hypothetical protein